MTFHASLQNSPLISSFFVFRSLVVVISSSQVDNKLKKLHANLGAK